MNNRECIPGVVFSLLIGVVSLLLSGVHPAFDTLVVSIIIGMFVGNTLAKPEQLQSGIGIMLKYFLPMGIALYGTQLTFGRNIDYGTWLYVAVIFIFFFVLTLTISKLLKLPGTLSLLLASGLAVCGASAIAVISPLVGAKKEDTSISVISILVIGLLSIVFFPLFWEDIGFSVRDYAFFSGTTIPMLGQVKIAVLETGSEGVGLAVRFKLIRVSMLLFVAAAVAFVYGRKKNRVSVPWFLVVFVIFAFLVNFVKGMEAIAPKLEPVSKFFLSSALASIGLSVDLDSIMSEGSRPLTAVFLSWCIGCLFVYAGLRLLGV
ncbi:MAG TPA: putative sulfate exporter family transporter [Thermodesulfovibrionales bacterium]|nr:putative sulfate exporter family transporter [Thermodesulfovibrionales bacterium]